MIQDSILSNYLAKSQVQHLYCIVLNNLFRLCEKSIDIDRKIRIIFNKSYIHYKSLVVQAEQEVTAAGFRQSQTERGLDGIRRAADASDFTSSRIGVAYSFSFSARRDRLCGRGPVSG